MKNSDHLVTFRNIIKYLLKYQVFVLRLKGRNARHHLVDDAAESPEVTGFTGARVGEYLRTDVLSCSNKTIPSPSTSSLTRPVTSNIIFRGNYLGRPEVCEEDVHVGTEQNIFRLQVPVYDVTAVKMLDSLVK